MVGYSAGDPDSLSTTDSAARVRGGLWWLMRHPRSVTGLGGGTCSADTPVHEVHVQRFTMHHPGAPPEPGRTYPGQGHEAASKAGRPMDLRCVFRLRLHPIEMTARRKRHRDRGGA